MLSSVKKNNRGTFEGVAIWQGKLYRSSSKESYENKTVSTTQLATPFYDITTQSKDDVPTPDFEIQTCEPNYNLKLRQQKTPMEFESRKLQKRGVKKLQKIETEIEALQK